MFFTSMLLATFAPSQKFSSGFQSLYQRYQALTIIYTNLSIFLGLLIWILINSILSVQSIFGIFLASFPLIAASLWSIKRKKIDYAIISILLNLHWMSFNVGLVSKFSLGSMYLTGMIPIVSCCLRSSIKVYAISLCICFFQITANMAIARERFQTIFNDDQADDIFQLQVIVYVGFVLVSTFCYIHKAINYSMWETAKTDYEMMEEISRETVQAVTAKDLFVSSLSHEIRNPLNSMNGSIDYLIRVTTDEAHLQILNNAKLSGDVLLNLLTNVLDAAKLKTDKMELSFCETDPIDIMKKIRTIHSSRLQEKNIQTQTFISKSLPSILWIDSSRLLQIMMNLFSNASKFTSDNGKIYTCISWSGFDESHEELLVPITQFMPEDSKLDSPKLPTSFNDDGETQDSDERPQKGSIPSLNFNEFTNSEIRNHSYNLGSLKPFPNKPMKNILLQGINLDKNYYVWNPDKQPIREFSPTKRSPASILCQRMKKAKGYLKIQISDTGCGISKENIPKLFNMFSQADNNVSSVHGGSGLGLFICKQLIQKMGGDIALYSEVKKGTTFVFYLPVCNEVLSEGTSPRSASPREKVRALVVDDYEYNRDLHKLLLEREGVQVDLACNGREAIDKYILRGGHYYDFILMDVQMPEIDGFGAAKKIREWEAEKDQKQTKIYFLSGAYYSEEDVMNELKIKNQIGKTKSFGIQCLKKPVNVDVVKKIVDKYSHRD